MFNIQRSFILKTRQILQNEPIALTFIWSLMRMVGFTHVWLYDKHNNFDFPVVNFPYLSNNINIPESPVYRAVVLQLIRYVRVCSKYEDLLF